MIRSIWRRHRGLIITCGAALAIGLVVFVVAVAASTLVQGGGDNPNGFVTFSDCGNGPGMYPQIALSVDFVGEHQYKTYSQEACDTSVLLPKAGLRIWVKRTGQKLQVSWSAPVTVEWSTIEVEYGDGNKDTVTLAKDQTTMSVELAVNDSIQTITVRGLGPHLPPAVNTPAAQTSALGASGRLMPRSGPPGPLLSPIITA